MKSAFALLALGMALLLAGCRSDPSRRALDRPMFGASMSRFVIDTDRAVGLHELARWAKIIGPYKQLTAREIAAIRVQLQRGIDDLIEVEYQRLETARPSAKPRTREQRIDLRAMARERVLARLGKDLALPLLTSDNRSAVAFARVGAEGLEVTATAYEVDKPSHSIGAETQITAADGKRARVLPSQAGVKIASP